MKNVDPAECPAVPGCARLCPVGRLSPSAIQAWYSRAGAQEGTRWQSTTPSNQNRILLKRRPHQNLIDNEIWTPWATFSTKSFFCDFIPNQKHRFGSKKRCPPRRLPYGKRRFSRCPVLPGLARLGDSGRPGSKPFPHAPEFRKALVGKAQLPQTRIAYSSDVDHVKT